VIICDFDFFFHTTKVYLIPVLITGTQEGWKNQNDIKGKFIRLLYRGKFLEDHLSLKSTKVEDGDSMQW
jgi:hypothetical protein